MDRQRYILSALLLSLVMLMGSCSKDLEPEGIVPAPTDTVEMREVEIEFEYEIEDSFGDLRLSQRVDASGKPKTYMENDTELTLVMHTSPRIWEPYDEESGFWRYDWYNQTHIEAAKKARNGNKVLAKIKLPIELLDSEESALSFSIYRANNFYHPADHGDVVFSPYLFEPSVELIQPNADGFLNLPYMHYTTDLFKVKMAGEKIVLPRLTFKPRGTLLRFDLHNDTGAPVVANALDMWTNVIPRQISFFNSQTAYGIPVSEHTTWGFAHHKLDFPDGEQTIAPNELKHYYFWITPYEIAYDSPSPDQPFSTLIRAIGPNGEVYAPFYSEHPIKEGFKVIKLSLSPQQQLTAADVFPTGHIPLAHMAEYNMASPTSLATSLDEELASYRTLIKHSDLGTNPSQAVEINAPDAADRGYYLGDHNHWLGALSRISISVLDYIHFSLDTKFDLEEKVPLASYGLNRVYWLERPKHGLQELKSYALRFIGNANRQLTAYRYEVKSKTIAGRKIYYLEVKARYLGPRFVGNYDTISDEGFWAQPDPNEIMRTLPIARDDTGDHTPLNSYMLPGIGSNPVEFDFLNPSYKYLVLNAPGGFWGPNPDGHPVRLFMRNPPSK